MKINRVAPFFGGGFSPKKRLTSADAMSAGWLVAIGPKSGKKGASDPAVVADVTKAAVAQRIADYRVFSTRA